MVPVRISGITVARPGAPLSVTGTSTVPPSATRRTSPPSPNSTVSIGASVIPDPGPDHSPAPSSLLA